MGGCAPPPLWIRQSLSRHNKKGSSFVYFTKIKKPIQEISIKFGSTQALTLRINKVWFATGINLKGIVPNKWTFTM